MQATSQATLGASVSDRQMFMLFPTPMFISKLSDLTICDRAEKKIRELQKAGVGRSTPANAIRSYMTPDDLYNLPEMKEMVDAILGESGRALDAYAVKRDSHYITSLWANVTHPNRPMNAHVHPNCLLSGLVYIKTPANCGPTSFASPRKFTKNLEPRYTQKNELNSDFIVIPAEKGRMLIWPSYIPHSVEEGTADESEDRIVLPFNIMIRGRIELLTASLTLS
jgi:uncharacterized protein (TIGR02466 family)